MPNIDNRGRPSLPLASGPRQASTAPTVPAARSPAVAGAPAHTAKAETAKAEVLRGVAPPRSDFVPAAKAPPPSPEASKLKDVRFDGMYVGAGGRTYLPSTRLSEVPGVTPRDNPHPAKTIVYTNGILTPLASQAEELQSIADRSGAKVVGVHNATEGACTDLSQCVKDKMGKGKNPAVNTLADTIYSELKADRPVSVMGYSQGGLITARALFDVRNRLRLEDGMSASQVKTKMGLVDAETFGAASTKYPDGPNYVHYVNKRDVVPMLAGLGGGSVPQNFFKHPGEGAVVHHFSEGGRDLLENHSLENTYLKHRVPFEQARANQF